MAAEDEWLGLGRAQVPDPHHAVLARGDQPAVGGKAQRRIQPSWPRRTSGSAGGSSGSRPAPSAVAAVTSRPSGAKPSAEIEPSWPRRTSGSAGRVEVPDPHRAVIARGDQPAVGGKAQAQDPALMAAKDEWLGLGRAQVPDPHRAVLPRSDQPAVGGEAPGHRIQPSWPRRTSGSVWGELRFQTRTVPSISAVASRPSGAKPSARTDPSWPRRTSGSVWGEL